MKIRFRSDIWHVIIAITYFVLLVTLAIVFLIFLCDTVLAEGEGIRVWVLCDPDSFVCIRESPRKTAYAFGGSSCGSQLETDGKVKGSYLHVINVPAEKDTGWISSQYIVYDEPVLLNQSATVVSNGRLAARKGIGGNIRKWLQPMDTLKVLYWTDEWCLTNYGYVQSMFLELDGEN